EALGMTNLNGGTLFNAEFGIRHRAAPYRKGQVLHSVFAAAALKPSSTADPASVRTIYVPLGYFRFIPPP
ncbi:hypothetical protein, partial [Pseudomonas gessardii]|uniref:hypothetical protein n=1 Tax=Pseudomonas gessardii TaxID=78544 RepID=UPI0039EAF089